MAKKSLQNDPVRQIKDLQKEVKQLKAELAAVRLSDARFRSLLENVPNLITIVDRKGTLQYISRSVRGLAKEKICGMNIFDSIKPEFHNELGERSHSNEKVGFYRRYDSSLDCGCLVRRIQVAGRRLRFGSQGGAGVLQLFCTGRVAA